MVKVAITSNLFIFDMHPPLVVYRHPGCEEVIIALEECHRSGFFNRFMGGCNQAKYDLTLCLRSEIIKRLERSRVNRETSKEKRKRVETAWKEIDEES
ncbi:COX assembly mitochondrial protein 1 [Neolecta irregularis DAH-3]|uniref:COX assembly mitochondrial protein n=1 Tax=Neolecta irregularis (strain DAH-3) TaxID=1198029 RepID=A0A1U7LWG4_NEOID|nr:COX assembly mitochondrial protein 1 [Neolecta irregularis DAH-3]|eukprot:OLL26851.1 COX assembly mitochondrial protein 1 [Neolecta irregularis DAH-3]